MILIFKNWYWGYRNADFLRLLHMTEELLIDIHPNFLWNEYYWTWIKIYIFISISKYIPLRHFNWFSIWMKYKNIWSISCISETTFIINILSYRIFIRINRSSLALYFTIYIYMINFLWNYYAVTIF